MVRARPEDLQLEILRKIIIIIIIVNMLLFVWLVVMTATPMKIFMVSRALARRQGARTRARLVGERLQHKAGEALL